MALKTTKPPYDFSGIASQYGVVCDDGRVIDHGAFAHQDGITVPLVWRHGHNDIENVLGHGVMKEEPGGVRVYGFLNDTEYGAHARQLVQHKDLRYLSIWANKLTLQHGGHVAKGNIREISLVLAGKNPGASIDDVVMHGIGDFDVMGEGYDDDTVIIYTGIPLELGEAVVEHGATPDQTVKDVINSFNRDQKNMLSFMVMSAMGKADSLPKSSDDSGPTMDETYKTLSEEQKNALHFVLGHLTSDSISHGGNMPTDQTPSGAYNVFEDSGFSPDPAILAHDALNTSLALALTTRTSLRDVVIDDDDSIISHGITNIESLFPNAQLVTKGGPPIYDQELGWVQTVLNGVYRTPFSRIKTRFSDMTEDEARARGYIKGSQKIDAIYKVAHRETFPKTIYTKQSLDHDDILDITDFSVVAWVKKSMRAKLRQETARAVLIGDGRSLSDNSHINHDNVRPVAFDDPFYALPYIFSGDATEVQMIDGVTRARGDYKGSGSPTFFVGPKVLADMMLHRNSLEMRLYDTRPKLASALAVSKIVEVPDFDFIVNPDNADQHLVGIVVNLRDYVIGADKGGQTSFFEDFDLDVNKMKWLLETRISGALTKPHSALVFWKTVESGG